MSREIELNKESLTKDDIGKIFWMVEYQGVITQYLIDDVYENGEGKNKLEVLTSFKDGYKLKDNVEYKGFYSLFGIETMRKENFYMNLEEAKKESLIRYEREVNPNGDYRVGRFFDDVWEAWESEILPKQESEERARQLNKKDRCYVSYKSVDVTIHDKGGE